MGKSIESEKGRAPQFLIDALLPESEDLFENIRREQKEKSLLRERAIHLHTKASSILNRYGKKERSRKLVGSVKLQGKWLESFKPIKILRTPPTEVRRGNNITYIYLYARIENGKLPKIVIKSGLPSDALYEESGLTREVAEIQENGNFSIGPFAGKSVKERVDFIEKTLEFIEKDLKSKK